MTWLSWTPAMVGIRSANCGSTAAVPGTRMAPAWASQYALAQLSDGR